jgi:hypothetical protein
LLVIYQLKPRILPATSKVTPRQASQRSGHWRPGHPKGPCPRLEVKDRSEQAAVASVRVLRTRKPGGAVWTPWAEPEAPHTPSAGATAVSPRRRVSRCRACQWGTPATWRRAGSNRMPAQEDVLENFVLFSGLRTVCTTVKYLRGTVGTGRARKREPSREVKIPPSPTLPF